jgi:hypothetical protein
LGKSPDAETAAYIAAAFVVGVLDLADVPRIATDWLVAGADGDSLRQLAGYKASDQDHIKHVLPDALADIGLSLPSPVAAVACLSRQPHPAISLRRERERHPVVGARPSEDPVLEAALRATEHDLGLPMNGLELAPIIDGLDLFIGLTDGRYHGTPVDPAVLEGPTAACVIAGAAQETVIEVLDRLVPWCQVHDRIAIPDCRRHPAVWQCDGGAGHSLGAMGAIEPN